MAEQNQQQSVEEVPDHPQFRKQKPVEDNSGPVVRGDGTVLPDRGDRPKNPLKRVWPESGESANHKAEKEQPDEQKATGETASEPTHRDEL